MTKDYEKLTKRETEILNLLCAGMTKTSIIADTLHIAKSTVKAHLRIIYCKIGVSDKAEAIAKTYLKNMPENGKNIPEGVAILNSLTANQ